MNTFTSSRSAHERNAIIQSVMDKIHARGGRFLRKHQIDDSVSVHRRQTPAALWHPTINRIFHFPYLLLYLFGWEICFLTTAFCQLSGF
jgi:hypothetical protein